MEYIIDHDVKDVVKMLLEKTGSRIMLKEFNKDPSDVEFYITFLKAKSKIFKRFNDEINFWL